MINFKKQLLKQGSITKEKAEKTIRFLEFLSTCDQEDLYILSDCTILNDIIACYTEMAIENGSIYRLFSVSAEEALIRFYGYNPYANMQDNEDTE